MNTAITIGSKIVVSKGCKALNITAHTSATVVAIQPMGAEWGYFVKVTFQFTNGFNAGKQRTLWARHMNRLGDITINLNDGNPLHKVQIVRK